MNIEEVFQFLKEHGKQYCQEKLFIKKFPDYYQYVLSWDFPSDFKFSQKLYHYFYNDPNLKLGTCPVCGNRCKFIGFNIGYTNHCSISCSALDKDVLFKKKNTCIEKYGKEFYSQTNERKDRITKTSMEKYGTSHPFKSKEVRDKIEKTNIIKYGSKNVFQSELIKDKIKETNLKNLGVENPTQSEIIKNKVKETNLKKLGVENPLQSQKIKEKVKQTNLNKYGYEYGLESPIVKEKRIITLQEKYGVINYSQTKDWSHKKKKRILYDGIYFDSSWEVKVYQYCKENNIPCEYQPNITFEYLYNNETHQYHPDFLINGKLYEVKGNQFFEGNKMICPYNRNNYKDELAEAKHQCMIKNGVIILRKNDIEKLKERI